MSKRLQATPPTYILWVQFSLVANFQGVASKLTAHQQTFGDDGTLRAAWAAIAGWRSETMRLSSVNGTPKRVANRHGQVVK